ncbi:MAG: lipoate--protein ligase family protein [Candidatus Aminicenantes bacterium]|nr:lipoate--protein ligase family protein [Candidatus Aminicenantes bacterium]
MTEWDLIVDAEPGEGSWNMAVDEFLFESIRRETSKTVLRFYAWRRPTASIGYSQKIDKVVDTSFCNKNGIDIVRRLTGGKLVLHHREVTYSLSSCDLKSFSPTVSESYKRISEAMMLGLKKMGLSPILADKTPQDYIRGHLPCFSRPARDEVMIAGGKIIGSAQKRIGPCFLQHGSIPLEENEKLLASVSSIAAGSDNLSMTSLCRAIGKRITFDRAVEMLAEGISEYFEVRLKKRTLSLAEQKSIRKIQRERYANPDWTFGGP